MKKIAEPINPSPTFLLPGKGVKIDKDERQIAYAILNIVATLLDNAQPWRLSLLHYPQELGRACL